MGDEFHYWLSIPKKKPLPLQKVMHTRKRHMELFQELNQKFQTLDRFRDIPNMGSMVSNRKPGGSLRANLRAGYLSTIYICAGHLMCDCANEQLVSLVLVGNHYSSCWRVHPFKSTEAQGQFEQGRLLCIHFNARP